MRLFEFFRGEMPILTNDSQHSVNVHLTTRIDQMPRRVPLTVNLPEIWIANVPHCATNNNHHHTRFSSLDPTSNTILNNILLLFFFCLHNNARSST